ncbi:hypothetical protein BDP27DRAFT_1417516 [Rhodocollybia butyracea]|uniref:Aminoglycoside phosphotransferase domain-containing protein n=1 Tax=Rhodocollybia butyracea TaxID=206335 RepID=A0A9P5PV73_9AGAR|nr:hypothetical protein BDP27DRAFT_1417516 [Rhodocollybia butyracea]
MTFNTRLKRTTIIDFPNLNENLGFTLSKTSIFCTKETLLMAEILDRLLNEASSRKDNSTKKRRATLKTSPSDAWSDAEVLERIKTAPALPDAMFTLKFIDGDSFETESHWNVFDLCSDTVVKRCAYQTPEGEVRALAFVHEHTSIPVPAVWPSYTPLQKFLVAWTLRPMSDEPAVCHGAGFLFPLRPAGPFSSSQELVAHFDKSGKCWDYSQPLVLTHCELSMRNAIVGDDGRLWLVDWTRSAFYPPYFEYIATMSAAANDKADHSWRKHIPIVTDGACVKELNFIGGWGPYGKG